MDLLIVVFISLILAVSIVVYEVKLGKFKSRGDIEERKIEAFNKDFPNKDIDSLKIEIEKISDMLLDNQESNRYTAKIQEKAKNDYKLEEFRDNIADNVEIIDYKNRKLTAQVSYVSGRIEYTMIMYMDIVNKGRVFLKNYKSMKRVLN